LYPCSIYSRKVNNRLTGANVGDEIIHISLFQKLGEQSRPIRLHLDVRGLTQSRDLISLLSSCQELLSEHSTIINSRNYQQKAQMPKQNKASTQHQRQQTESSSKTLRACKTAAKNTQPKE
jgi:hypothetical protein